MRKTNWKILLLIWAPSFLLMQLLFGLGGAIGAAVSLIPTYIITKLFKIDMNIYYDHKGKRITRQDYEKLDRKNDYGFNWLPKWVKKKLP